ncbi:MAG: haloacid dehalogenase, partial [Promethearchaeota archaeon]
MSAYLEELNRDREDIIKISREMIRNCSIAIKLIHRTEFESYKEKIEEVKKNHKNLVDLVQKNPLIFSKYLKTPEQEYMEAISLYSIIKEKPFPNPIDYGVEKMNYLLGLADVIGELRRYILDNIRKEEMENIEKILEDMDTI